MLLLAEVPDAVAIPVPLYTLDGMTLLIGGFFFYCLARQERIKSRTHYWAVFACLLLTVLLYTLRLMLYNSPLGQVATGVFIGLTQAAGLVLTVLYVGGLRAGDVASQLRDAAADFRRAGEPEKPVLVPLRGETPAAKDPVPPPRVVIDLPKS